MPLNNWFSKSKKCGGSPFIVLAIGSHGGGTAKGQKEILVPLSVTEEDINTLIRATMDVIKIRETEYHTQFTLKR